MKVSDFLIQVYSYRVSRLPGAKSTRHDRVQQESVMRMPEMICIVGEEVSTTYRFKTLTIPISSRYKVRRGWGVVEPSRIGAIYIVLGNTDRSADVETLHISLNGQWMQRESIKRHTAHVSEMINLQKRAVRRRTRSSCIFQRLPSRSKL